MIRPLLDRDPSVFSRWSMGSRPVFGWVIFGSELKGGCLSLFLVFVTGCLRLRPGFPLHWILRMFCLVLVGISCMLRLLMSSSPSTRWTGLFSGSFGTARMVSEGLL